MFDVSEAQTSGIYHQEKKEGERGESERERRINRQRKRKRRINRHRKRKRERKE